MSITDDPNFPRTRDARRRQYQVIRASLVADTPAATLANVRSSLEGFLPATRRPSDPSPIGVWLPAFTVLALAQALYDAERKLARHERQAARRMAS
jgi:hypothetical protein